jgi:SAM-dependent methyltransferase
VAAGFTVLGIDISAPMIARARRRVPEARFQVGSLLSVELPPCVAVTAIGEAINYLFDPANNTQAIGLLFERAHEALVPGGIFVFDAAGPGRVAGTGPTRTHVEGDGWAVLVTSEEDPHDQTLTRRITTFRKDGDGYRRDHEIHRLRLYPEAELAELLRRAGFSVRITRNYGAMALPQGLVGFIAGK